MFAAVTSWVTISTLAGNATLPLTWSWWLCVLMRVVTGLSVSSPIASRIDWPQPGFLESTTTTPPLVTKTAVLPPPPCPRRT